MNTIINENRSKEDQKLDQAKISESSDPDILLEVNGLKTQFFTEEGIVKAVDGISFNMYKDEVLGLVGETGCGKSVTALSILRLVRAPGEIIEGTIIFDKNSLLEKSEKEMRGYRGKDITMIFQDPLNSLNPVLSVGEQLYEVFELHQKHILKEILDNLLLERKNKQKKQKELKKKLKDSNLRLTEAEIEEITKEITKLHQETKHIPKTDEVLEEKGAKILKEVGIADERGILKRYPHELSGGMRQRVMIAMALSCNPKLLIADEPTTALDVTIQAQILELMKDLKKKFKTSVLLITHDLGIIAEMCDRVAVMYSGNIVEYALATDLFNNPRHPYTIGLIAAIPSIEKRDSKLQVIRGMVPNLIYPPSGCRFHPRCDERMEICDKVKPKLNEIGDKFFVACHLFDEEYKNSPKYVWTDKEDDASHRV